MSALNTAVSGMAAQQYWLQTISQNVANANTTGFKREQAEFESLMDAGSLGSVPRGDGVMASNRTLAASQGAIVGSTSSTDLAISGQGMFIVQNGAGETYLTRAGSFVPNAAGDLVNAAGYTLLGSDLANGAVPAVGNSFAGLKPINVNVAGLSAVPTTSGEFTANLPADSTAVAAGSLPSTNSANAVYTEKTTLVAYDNLGEQKTFDVYLTNEGSNTWEAAVYDQSKAAGSGGFPYSSGPIAVQQLTFSAANGTLSGGSPVTFQVPGGQVTSLSLSGCTQLAGAFAVSSASVNGNAAGKMTGVVVGADGTLSFSYSNGVTSPAWQVALASVPSPDNLTPVTGDVFSITAGSGSATLGVPGSGGLGTVDSDALESSTVDMATELTDMISAQSAYEANSKVFQTGSTLLDVLNKLQV